MAVTIETRIFEYFTWGSYPYETWGGDELKTWGGAGVLETIVTDKEKITVDEGNVSEVTFDSFLYAFEDTNATFLSNTIRKALTKNRFESLSFDEILNKNYVANRTFAEPIDICETYWDVIQFYLGFSETFSITDSIKKAINKRSLYNIKLKEAKYKSLSALRKDGIALADLYDRDVVFKRDYAEGVSVLEKPSKASSLPFDESFGVTDTSYRDNNKVLLQSLSVVDTYKRNTKTIRNFSASIGIGDAISKNTIKLSFDDVAFDDRYLKTFGGTYSNMFITEGEFSDEDFADSIDTPPAYTKFVDFKVGEYDYEEALVRISMESNVQAQPTAAGIVQHVDIPDTDDRGNVIITDTSAPTMVQFNKSYYVVPEVQVTLRSASTASGFVTPNVVDITTAYFTVELLTSGGERTAGTISWASKGY